MINKQWGTRLKELFKSVWVFLIPFHTYVLLIHHDVVNRWIVIIICTTLHGLIDWGFRLEKRIRELEEEKQD